jgi:hypothetical protein
MRAQRLPIHGPCHDNLSVAEGGIEFSDREDNTISIRPLGDYIVRQFFAAKAIAHCEGALGEHVVQIDSIVLVLLAIVVRRTHMDREQFGEVLTPQFQRLAVDSADNQTCAGSRCGLLPKGCGYGKIKATLQLIDFMGRSSPFKFHAMIGAATLPQQF